MPGTDVAGFAAHAAENPRGPPRGPRHPARGPRLLRPPSAPHRGARRGDPRLPPRRPVRASRDRGGVRAGRGTGLEFPCAPRHAPLHVHGQSGCADGPRHRVPLRRYNVHARRNLRVRTRASTQLHGRGYRRDVLPVPRWKFPRRLRRRRHERVGGDLHGLQRRGLQGENPRQRNARPLRRHRQRDRGQHDRARGRPPPRAREPRVSQRSGLRGPEPSGPQSERERRHVLGDRGRRARRPPAIGLRERDPPRSAHVEDGAVPTHDPARARRSDHRTRTRGDRDGPRSSHAFRTRPATTSRTPRSGSIFPSNRSRSFPYAASTWWIVRRSRRRNSGESFPENAAAR